MDDYLPQPWVNLGISLVMQKRFDEAEAAYRRALEIDPGYGFARKNLENLSRQRVDPDFDPIFKLTSPFEDVDTVLNIEEED